MRPSSPKARGAAGSFAATEAEGVTRRRQLAGVARPTRRDRSRPEGPGAPYEGERRSCARRRWRREPPRLRSRPKAVGTYPPTDRDAVGAAGYAEQIVDGDSTPQAPSGGDGGAPKTALSMVDARSLARSQEAQLEKALF